MHTAGLRDGQADVQGRTPDTNAIPLRRALGRQDDFSPPLLPD